MSPTPDENDPGPAPRRQERGAHDGDTTEGRGSSGPAPGRQEREAPDGDGGAAPLWHRSALGRVAVMWGVVLRRFRVYVEQRGNGR
jgi:hypothetical protein